MSEQGPNINDYGVYLTARVKAFASIKTDYVKSKADQAGQGRLRKLSIDKGLLRETESVQKLIGPLIKCKFLENEVNNEITLTAFRLLVADLLVLFQVANEGVINVLEHYFEMSKPDAERALAIYKRFVAQTDGVIIFMSLARSLESVTRLEIPNLQHAPTSLGNSLEEYINDPDFEQNRIQYLAQKDRGASAQSPPPASDTMGRIGTAGLPLKSALKKGNDNTNPFGAPQLPQQLISSGNTELIDFFGSIEPAQSQQVYQSQPNVIMGNVGGQANGMASMGTNPYAAQQQVQAQMTGQQSANTNPYQVMPNTQQHTGFEQRSQMQPQIQQHFPTTAVSAQLQYSQGQSHGYSAYSSQTLPTQSTGAGFGSFTPQAIPQSSTSGSLQPQTTGSNPFRRSMLPPIATGASEFGMMSPQRTGGNPFSSLRGPPTTGTPLFASNQSYQTTQQQTPIQTQTTGNPFARGRVVSDALATNYGAQQPQQMQVNMTGNLMPQQTGGNPFRKSMMPVATGTQNFGGR